MVATVGLTPSTAYAEANPPGGCTKGYFCMYSGPNQTGTLLAKKSGEWAAATPSQFINGVQSVFNNGSACWNCDHVDFLFWVPDHNWSVCLHFNPGPGSYKQNFTNFAGGAIAKSVHWRGEC
ncbi:MAG TPA: peptidase inhibitor family I36 protein [Asanoa sp.]|nr:peptidase inhibitor family I36 protein [Asanoa sp.]